jgi:hypothetical protein
MVAVPDNTAAVDAVVFCVMVTELVAVQPLLPVTVTVYVAGAETDNAAIVSTTALPSLHEYVPPPVAVKLIEVVVQFKTVVAVLLVMPAVGAVIFCVIVMVLVALQPMLFVTVTI